MSTTRAKTSEVARVEARAEGPRFDVAELRGRFPILSRQVHHKPLIYLDNAATTQKPVEVIEATERYYRSENANIHRGLHALADAATAAYEATRAKAAAFIGAEHAHEVVFTRGTTESINLVASSYARRRLRAGDEILITEMEHHSNIVPWQLAAAEAGATVKAAPVDERGNLVVEAFRRLLSERTKVVSLTHVSNVLGTVNPVKEMTALAHEAGAVVMVDGAQAAPHLRIDVREIGCDFYALSAHKMYGPTGTGILYGRTELLEEMPPYQGGGEMIETVSIERSTWNELPWKFEAGTPNIAGVAGLSAAIDFILSLDREQMAVHEEGLLRHATGALSAIKGMWIIGTAERKSPVVSFIADDVHPTDLGTILDRYGIAIRTGHHCAEPLMKRYGLPGAARASFALYNTKAEVDALVEGIVKARKLFQ
jgi:cysteine desulfurase/selenocysteine lyase